MTDVTITYYAPALQDAEEKVIERIADEDVTCSTYAATRALCLHATVPSTGAAAIIDAATRADGWVGDIDGLQLREVSIDTDQMIVPAHTPSDPYQVCFAHASLAKRFDAWLASLRLERFPVPTRPAADDLPTFGVAPRDLTAGG